MPIHEKYSEIVSVIFIYFYFHYCSHCLQCRKVCKHFEIQLSHLPYQSSSQCCLLLLTCKQKAESRPGACSGLSLPLLTLRHSQIHLIVSIPNITASVWPSVSFPFFHDWPPHLVSYTPPKFILYNAGIVTNFSKT